MTNGTVRHATALNLVRQRSGPVRTSGVRLRKADVENMSELPAVKYPGNERAPEVKSVAGAPLSYRTTIRCLRMRSIKFSKR